MKFNDLLIIFRNGAIILFLLWLNFSPTPEPPTQTQNIKTEPIVSLRGGRNESSEKLGLFGRWNNFVKRSTTGQNPSTASPNTQGITDVKKDTSNVQAQKSDSLPGEKIKYSPGGSPSGNDNDPSTDLNEWMSPKIPDAEKTISNEFFWTMVEKNTESNQDSSDEEEDDFYDCDAWDKDEWLDKDLDKKPRRRLMSVSGGPSPTPTAQLDKALKKKFDLTTIQIPRLEYNDRDGRRLVLMQKTIKKLTYCHQTDLGLYNPTDRVPCPLQTDSNKYQRIDCFAMTDKSVKDVIIKILEGTTTTDRSRYITLLMPMPFFETQSALGYLDTVTGSCIFFHADSGKIWSVTRYGSREVLDLLLDPSIVQNPMVL